jgi:hypothetical protein
MAEVRTLRASDFEEVRSTLLDRLNPAIPVEAWRRLFVPPWPVPEPTVGYGLIDSARGVVGFLGTLRAQVKCGDRNLSLCNLTSWIVLPEFRSQSLALLAPELRRTDVTLTNMTPTAQVRDVMKQLGFQVLETHRTVLTPPMRRGAKADVITDLEAMRSTLPPHDLQVLKDHLPAGSHLAVIDPDLGPCYLLYGMVRRMRLPCARLYHIGDADIFRRVAGTVHRHLLRRHGAVFLDFDSRLIGDEPFHGGRQHRMPVPRMFRSSDVSAAQVPCTYSELALLRI